LQKKEAPGRAAANAGRSADVPPIVHEVLRSPGQPLDPETRAFMELRFGHDFSQVRVHTDARAAESARAAKASAYTVGRDIIWGSGAPAANTASGKNLLAHELTHVIQQNITRITMRINPTIPKNISAKHKVDAAANDIALGMQHVKVHFDNINLALQKQVETIDVDLVPASPKEQEEAKKLGIELPTVSKEKRRAIGVAQPLIGEQTPELAALRWITPKYIKHIQDEYRDPVTFELAKTTGIKVWTTISTSGTLDMDIYFRRPKSTTQQHVKLIMYLHLKKGNILVAKLFDWLGPDMIEIKCWEGLVEIKDGKYYVKDLPSSHPPLSPHPQPIFEEETETV